MITNQIIADFLKCRQRAFLSLTNKTDTPTGFELHQQRIVKRLMDRFTIVNESRILKNCTFHGLIPSDISSQVYVINPSVTSNTCRLTLDAITILPSASGTSKLTCVPIMASSNVVVSKIDRLTLCIISLILQKQIPHFKLLHCTIISEWNAPTTFSLETHIREARHHLQQLLTMNEQPTQQRFYKNDHCETCPNKATCMQELISKADMSLLGSMSRGQIAGLNRRGILTINQLSYTFRHPKSRTAAMEPARPNFALKALALREKQTFVLEPPIFPDQRTEVFVDFEGFPDERCVYLIGMIIREKKGETAESFWAESLNDTEDIMHAFLDKLRSINDYTLYHFGSFEARVLRRFRQRTNNRSLLAEIDTLLSKSVNVLSLFSQNVYPPTYTNGLKEIASFLGFKWSTQEISGVTSIIIRQKWEFEQLDNYNRLIITYTLDDCTALQRTNDWLSNIAGRATEGCGDLRSASDVQSTSFHKWGKARFEVEELDVINKCSYFDYQRSKVYLRTNKTIRTALRRENKAKARINAVDKQIWLPERCPHCGGKEVHFASQIQRRRRILDLRFMKNGVKKWVTELLGKDFRCAVCDNVFSVSMYGRNLIIWSMNQHITYRISTVRIGQMLQENYNIEIPEYKLSYLKRDLANEYRDTATGILRNLVRGPLIQIDETPAFVRDSPSTYVWVFASIDSVYYLLKQSREASFLHELRDGFNGVLVSDFYSGYDSLPCKQQRCLIHFIRDLNGDFRKNQLNLELRVIVVRFGELLRTIIATIDQYGLRRRHLEKHLRDVDAFYLTVGEDRCETDIAAKYRKRLTRNRERLFEFLRHDGIPWNNNNAEAAIKPLAKYR